MPSFLISPLSKDGTGAVEMRGKVAEGGLYSDGALRGKLAAEVLVEKYLVHLH